MLISFRNAILCFLCIGAIQVKAQDLFDSLFEVKNNIHQEKYEDALDILLKIEERCQESDNDTIKVLFYESIGFIKFEKKDYVSSISYLELVPELYEKINIKDRNYIESFLALGISYQRLGNDSIAEKYYRRGLLRTDYSQYSDQYRPSFYLNLGNIYRERGDSILAKECFKHIDLSQFNSLIYADFSFEESESIAIIMREKGEYEQCLQIYDRLIAHASKIIGTDNEYYARMVTSKAFVLDNFQKRISEAKTLYKEVIMLSEKIGCYNESVLLSNVRYMYILAFEGDSLEIDKMMPMALSICEQGQNNEYSIDLLYYYIGEGAHSQDHFDISIPYFEKYLSFSGNKGISYLKAANMLAVSYLRIGNNKRAEFLLKELLDTRSEQITQNPLLNQYFNHNYGRALMLDNRYSEALEYLNKANDIYRQHFGQDFHKTIQYIEECKKNI